MKQRTLPMTVMIFAIVVCLGLVGIVYTMWSETLTVTGTVSTGEVDIGFVPTPVVQECVDVGGVQECPEPEAKKDAANCIIKVSPGGDGSDGISGFDIQVTGAYPSYHCKVQFAVENLGSVPVHIQLPAPAIGPNVGLPPWNSWPWAQPPWARIDLSQCYQDDVQVHSGSATVPCTIDIHFTNEMDPCFVRENGDYDFGFSIVGHQWNEEPGGTLYLPNQDGLKMYSEAPASDSYIRSKFDANPDLAGFDIIEGTWYKAWCIDKENNIYVPGWYPVYLLSTEALDQPGGDPYWRWPRINYLLNRYDGTGGEDELQKAIWAVVYDGTSTPHYCATGSQCETMYNSANGITDWKPTPGTNQWGKDSVMGVLAWSYFKTGSPGFEENPCKIQLLIIEVPWH